MTKQVRPCIALACLLLFAEQSQSANPSTSAHIIIPATSANRGRVVPPIESLRGGQSQMVAAQPTQAGAYSAPCSALGCPTNSTNENEFCAYTAVDTVNGGCIGGVFHATPLAPFQVICGESWAIDDGVASRTDVDWYLTAESSDSLTWCVTSEFDFEYEIWSFAACNSSFFQRVAGSGAACEPTFVSLRADGYHAAMTIFPSTSSFTPMNCNLGPWNYHVSLVTNCEIPCEEGSVDEGEGCSADPSVDNFNGGCLSSPNVYSPITPGQPVCGQISGSGFSRDTDWYRATSPLAVGDVVSWGISANFPHAIYIIDQRRGCATRQVGAALGDACHPSAVDWVVDSAGSYTFVVGALQSDYGYLCENGPWNYNATLDICKFGCFEGGTPEGELCDYGGPDDYNGGCNSFSFLTQPIALNQRICGQAWRIIEYDYHDDEFDIYRDTDWYLYTGTPGEILTWTVRAEFGVDIGATRVLPIDSCWALRFVPYTQRVTACAPTSLTCRVPASGEIVFYVVPGIPPVPPGQQLICNQGPWEYTAIVERAPCVCDCHADPASCDGHVNIFDVTAAINVAFRSFDAIPDPNVACPYDRTDVSCNGVTDIFDITRLINVAFRGSSAASEFCDPCAP